MSTFLWAISYPPSPSGRTHIQENYQYPKPSQSSGNQNKFQRGARLTANQGTSSTPNANPPQGKQQDSFEKTANERSLTVATWALAFVTLMLVLIAAGQAVLFLWQLDLMREGVDDAKKAAEGARETAAATAEVASAAQKSAETGRLALVALERPWLRLVILGAAFDRLWYQIEHPETPQYSVPLEIIFAFKNYGKFPAVIKEIFVSFDPAPAAPPAIKAAAHTFSGDPVISSNERTVELKAFIVGDAFNIPIRQNLLNDSFRIWFFGRVVYQNISGLGGDHITEFLWVYDRSNRRFGPTDEDGDDRNRCT